MRIVALACDGERSWSGRRRVGDEPGVEGVGCAADMMATASRGGEQIGEIHARPATAAATRREALRGANEEQQ